MPTSFIWGACPARLSFIHCIKTLSKHPGSSCGYPGTAGRQVHSFVPLRRTRYSPPGVAGQSRIVAFFVMNGGPALRAPAIFSLSVVGCRVTVCAFDALPTSINATEAKIQSLVDFIQPPVELVFSHQTQLVKEACRCC